MSLPDYCVVPTHWQSTQDKDIYFFGWASLRRWVELRRHKQSNHCGCRLDPYLYIRYCLRSSGSLNDRICPNSPIPVDRLGGLQWAMDNSRMSSFQLYFYYGADAFFWEVYES